MKTLLAILGLAFASCATTASFTHARSGAVTTLEGLRGHAVVINFWAEWCPPCIQEFPVIAGLVEQAGPDALLVPAYFQDRPLPGAPIYRWLDQQPAWFRDRVCWASRPARDQHDLSSIPLTVIYGRDGQVVERFVGSIVGREDDFRQALTRALEPATTVK